jgi:hypothetical protein
MLGRMASEWVSPQEWIDRLPGPYFTATEVAQAARAANLEGARLLHDTSVVRFRKPELSALLMDELGRRLEPERQAALAAVEEIVREDREGDMG